MKRDGKRRRVVVTGMGIVSPIGCSVAEFWDNALAGRSGIRRAEFPPVQGFQSTVAGQVPSFDPRSFGLGELQIRRLDRYAQFALAAAAQAFESSGLSVRRPDGDRFGISVSNAICGTRYMEEEFVALTERGTRPIDPAWVERSLYQASTFNAGCAELAAVYGARGPCVTVSTGCTGGLDAIGLALDTIRCGEADVMLAGAAEAPITPIAMAAFDVVGALSSKWNDTPSRASRPYDNRRDGFVLGEGSGVFVLEELGHALERGARILAEVRGFGSCNNAFHMTDLPPDGNDLARALRVAMKDASIVPEDVDYAAAHGSSTRQNDINETAAYKESLGEHAYRIAVSSLKSMCGHPLAAANALESVAAIMSIQDGRLHPTINLEEADPHCDLDYVPNRSVKRDVNVVLKNASGFSGIHSALVFAKHGYVGRMQ